VPKRGRQREKNMSQYSYGRGQSPSLSAKLDRKVGCLVETATKGENEEDEYDFNLSFSGGYVQNTNLSRVDKGQGNPQFKGISLQ